MQMRGGEDEARTQKITELDVGIVKHLDIHPELDRCSSFLDQTLFDLAGWSL
jgi:hypothetical protein